MTSSGRPLRLVSHNVYWFQGAPFDSKHPRGCRAAVLAQLTELYAQLEPDVLCLQEVHEAAIAHELAAALAMEVRHCPGGREAQYGGALLWRGAGAYEDWRDVEAAEPPPRIWQQLELCEAGGSGRMRIMNVHLPSDAGRSPEVGERQRLASLERVLAREPDVVMGDFNARPESAALAPLHEAGYVDAGARLGFGEVGTAGAGKRIDYAWVRGPVAARLARFAVVALDGDEALQPRDADKRTLSDHWPLWVEVEPVASAVGGDDAPAREEAAEVEGDA